MTWEPTHRHAEGGLYRLLGNGKLKADDEWLDAVIYGNERGELFVRSPASFAERFIEIGTPT